MSSDELSLIGTVASYVGGAIIVAIAASVPWIILSTLRNILAELRKTNQAIAQLKKSVDALSSEG